MDVNTLGDLSGNGRTLTSGNGAVLPYNASDPILGGQPSLSVDGGAAYSLGFNSVNTTMFANGSDVVCIFIGYKSTAGVSYYGEIAQFGTLGGTVDVYLLNYNVIGGSTYIATDELTNNYYVSGIDLTVANEAICLTWKRVSGITTFRKNGSAKTLTGGPLVTEVGNQFNFLWNDQGYFSGGFSEFIVCSPTVYDANQTNLNNYIRSYGSTLST